MAVSVWADQRAGLIEIRITDRASAVGYIEILEQQADDAGFQADAKELERAADSLWGLRGTKRRD